MSKVISVFNQKGGVGKSTTTINLGAALTLLGHHVLLIDMDSQANTTVGVGVDDSELEQTIFDLLKKDKVSKEEVEALICETEFKNLDLIPADIYLSNATLTLASVMSRENRLKRVVENIKEDYDYILIDCPPSLDLLSVNALVASSHIIIPISTDYFSVKGVRHLLNTVELVKDNLNEGIEIMGVLITKFDSRKNIAKNIRKALQGYFEDDLFNTIIRVNTAIEHSQDRQVPLIYYNKSCNAYIDYMKLGREVESYE